MSKKPGFTVKKKTPASAGSSSQEINLADFRAYLPAHVRPPILGRPHHHQFFAHSLATPHNQSTEHLSRNGH
jgi:hypothetical protein